MSRPINHDNLSLGQQRIREIIMAALPEYQKYPPLSEEARQIRWTMRCRFVADSAIKTDSITGRRLGSFCDVSGSYLQWLHWNSEFTESTNETFTARLDRYVFDELFALDAGPAFLGAFRPDTVFRALCTLGIGDDTEYLTMMRPELGLTEYYTKAGILRRGNSGGNHRLLAHNRPAITAAASHHPEHRMTNRAAGVKQERSGGA